MATMPTNIRITVLAENTAQGTGVLAEHGLAYWIEGKGQRVLFDTGQGMVLARNATKLNIPLQDVDAIVLSHGHYDHTGGLAEVLRDRSRVPIYAHPAARKAKYMRDKSATARAIGIPVPSEQALERPGQRVIETESPTTIFPGLTVTGYVPRTTDFEDTGGAFFLDAACSQRDPVADDQSLFFDTPEGIVVLLGCAHSGVVNTLRHIANLSGARPFHAVIGGMHLVNASPTRIAQTVDALRPLNLRLLAPCHCTGMPATVALWTAFPTICVACHAGKVFDFAG